MQDQTVTQTFTGFLLINKPADITSRDCVNKLQRLLPKKTKIGHAGTLDKFATGLLIIGIGRAATRMFSYLLKLDKVYEATAKLGELTDTFDLTGQLVQEHTQVQLSPAQLDHAIATFDRVYEQTPPAFSALKWQGKRLSDIARAEHIDDASLHAILVQKRRAVTIHDLELLAYDDVYMKMRAHVSHGTYIRALANDIAAKCGTVATTHALQRTAIGPFSLQNAQELAFFTDVKNIEQVLVSVEQVEDRLTGCLV